MFLASMSSVVFLQRHLGLKLGVNALVCIFSVVFIFSYYLTGFGCNTISPLRLQKCFVDSNTSPTSSIRIVLSRWVDFHFWVNCPFNLCKHWRLDMCTLIQPVLHTHTHTLSLALPLSHDVLVEGSGHRVGQLGSLQQGGHGDRQWGGQLEGGGHTFQFENMLKS